MEAVIAMSYFEKNAWSFSVTDYQAAIFGFLRNFVVTDSPLELNLSEAQKLSVLSLADAELTEVGLLFKSGILKDPFSISTELSINPKIQKSFRTGTSRSLATHACSMLFINRQCTSSRKICI